MTITPDRTAEQAPEDPAATDSQLSLSTDAARNLATTTKTQPQMRGITSRWLLRRLPWEEVSGGTYRVNRRLSLAVGRGRVAVVQSGADDIRIVPETLREIPVMRGFADDAVLAELAGLFTPRDFAPGEVIAEAGHPVDEVFILAHGRVERSTIGAYGEPTLLGVLTDGAHLGDVNDLASAAREAGEDPDCNLVLLLAAERDCSIDEATEQVVALHNDVVRGFEHSRAALAAVPSPELQRFVLGARAWMAGCLEWHDSSSRYK